MGTIRKDFKYKIIRNFLSKDEIDLLAIYTEIKHRLNNNKFDLTSNNNSANTSFYGDEVTDSILLKYKEKMEYVTNKKLLPTYSYWRMYTYNSNLHKHTDRKACEISVTINLASDGTKFPIYMNGKSLNLNPGDGAVYLGCEVRHWRDKFKGDYHTNLFLHYVDALGPNKEEVMDKRRFWGTQQSEI